MIIDYSSGKIVLLLKGASRAEAVVSSSIQLKLVGPGSRGRWQPREVLRKAQQRYARVQTALGSVI